MKRKQSMATYGHLYKLSYPVMEADVCQYCGNQNCLEWDHCPAITTAQLFVRSENIGFIKVLSCKECNLILSDKLIPDFPSRFYFVKEELLTRYKSDLINECRSSIYTNSETFKTFEEKFKALLYRIGFGLIKIEELSDKHIEILNLKTMSGITIIEHLSEIPGCGLLHISNITEEDQEQQDTCISDQDDDNKHQQENNYAPQNTQVNNTQLSQGIDFNQRLDEFKIFLRKQRIYTKYGYSNLLQKSPATQHFIDHPDYFFGCNWKELTSNVCVASKNGKTYNLDIIEKVITTDMINNEMIIDMYDLEDILYEFTISTRDEYQQFLNTLEEFDFRICFPTSPEVTYEEWIIW